MDTRSRRIGLLILALVLVGLALLLIARFRPAQVNPVASASASASATATPSTSQTAVPSGTAGEAILLAAGDIAGCNVSSDELVGQLAARLPGTIALFGDNAYPRGSPEDYANCFAPTWGGFLDRIRPVPGNHEYETREAAAYFSYFGARVGRLGEGWHSYDAGAWHVIALNSECSAIRGCGRGSPQLAWLVADLAAHPAACTLAYWHHPRHSSGEHGDNKMTEPLCQALSDAGADIVLEGHDHDYERMAPIDGIRSFVVDTGGRSRYEMIRPPNSASELRVNSSDGLLMLTLRDSSFDWQFIPARGSSLSDHGSGQCH